MELDGLREKYGDHYLVCENCRNPVDVEELIDELEAMDDPSVLMPEKIKNTAFTTCENCEGLTIHTLTEKNAFEPEEDSETADESNGHSKPQHDANGQSESTNGSSTPFSI